MSRYNFFGKKVVDLVSELSHIFCEKPVDLASELSHALCESSESSESPDSPNATLTLTLSL